ncbi:MAG: NAD(+) synthase [Lachnospiraceae bacterium]|nr:NAD(+) synthase [Lachnospiraceae bacterium]
MFDFYRVAVAVPDIKVADVDYNKEQIISMLRDAEEKKVKVLTFPELAVTGYTCADLFFQETLIKRAKEALGEIVSMSKDISVAFAVGAPVKISHQLYNASLFVYRGTVWGINIKTFLPNYNEFYEKRWFSSAFDLDTTECMISEIVNTDESYLVPVGNDIIYNMDDRLVVGVEICEDLWSPVTPSTAMAMSGANVILNLSASNETIGKRDYRRNLIKSKSQQLMCEYIYCSAGSSESSTDLVFSGHGVIFENGKLLAENGKNIDNNYIMSTDIDLGRIISDRIKGKTYKDGCSLLGAANNVREVSVRAIEDITSDGSMYNIARHPFIPESMDKRLARCNSIFEMQMGGLAKRLSVTGTKMVIGVSGGMDSTLSLLVAANTLRMLGRPMTDLVGVTMPAFGTTDRTYNNSLKLMESLGITIKTIPIKDACIQHYKDIGHDTDIKDITYENVQARERTQVLMDYANKIGGIVVGTGDLSELALGWCTYNADQMSMYGVNASIPKTLVRWMIDSVIEHDIFPDSTEVLKDILDTPISPELLPPDADGNIVQKTEDSVGPYELHDFFLFYIMRYGFSPAKIYTMAARAFDGAYDKETILKWMKMFYRRFFNQQFKRSCMPDGVKVGSVCLSPRGDWRMPSDASFNIWMKELENI